MKQAGAVVLVCCVSALVMGQAAPNQTVTAEEFVLRDKLGKPRALLGMDIEGPGIFFYDTNGRNRASLGLDNKGSGLSFYDTNGKTRALVRMESEGTSFTLKDSNGKTRAQMLYANDNGPSFILYDENERERATLGCTSLENKLGTITNLSSSSLVLFDKYGKVVFRVPRSTE